MPPDGPPTTISRHGKRQLGPHAFEAQMPHRIAATVAVEDDSNSLNGVVPKLAALLHRDKAVESAYLCTDAAVQVFRQQHEGNHFCGYHNIQMLCLTLDHPLLSNQKLTIPTLQQRIEHAWDLGHNSHARTQTGGIVGTRKHIGTSEAEALLLSHDVRCTGHAFGDKKAWVALFDFVESYFAAPSVSEGRIHITNKEPLFLQRPRHSLTIVGIERAHSGKRRLLVFDPAWQPLSAMRLPTDELVAKCSELYLQYVLHRYRKSQRYFRRFSAFEVLAIDHTQHVTTNETQSGGQ